MTVKVTITGQTMSVVTPYNIEFTKAAKQLAGRWDADNRCWKFDVRNEAAIRSLLLATYGTDGTVAPDTVSVRIVFKDNAYEDRGPITVCGRVIASASGRDSGARLGAGVVVESGGFRSGGSVKNWDTRVRNEGATIILHDFPRASIQIAAGSPDIISIEEIKPAIVTIDRDALNEERTRLLYRLSEIDEILEKNP